MADDTGDTPKKEKFIAALRACGNVSQAAKSAGIGRKTAYRWRDDDKDFADQWNDAVDEAGDVLEKEAWRRATKGVRRPVYQGGKRAGYVQEYSDTLLIFLLKGAKPDKYKDRRETNRNNFNYDDADLEQLDPYELQRIIAGDDPERVFAAARARRIREKAQAGTSQE